MKIIEEQGKTVDDAINKALDQLQVSRDQVSIEILDEGSRGIFGFMGTKPAKVKISLNHEATYSTIKEELKAGPRSDAPSQNARPATESREKNEKIPETIESGRSRIVPPACG